MKNGFIRLEGNMNPIPGKRMLSLKEGASPIRFHQSAISP